MMTTSRNTVTGSILNGILNLTLILIVGISVTGCASVRGLDERELLSALRVNDAKFDNLELGYTRVEDHRITPNRFDFSRFGSDPSTMPEDYWTPRTVKWTCSCSLTVRGSDAVLSSQFEPSLSEKDKYVTPGAYHKYGNVNGVVYNLSDMQLSGDDPSKSLPNYEKQLTTSKLKFPMGGLYDTRMAIEFAHGIGFGKRITSISSITTDGGRRIITGQIKIWAEDISKFEIELDDANMVRKALIQSNVRGNLTHFEVQTKGTVRQDGFVLAQRGSFKRIAHGTPKHQAMSTWRPTIQQDFRVEFNRVDQNLSDEQYSKLTEFKIEPLMQITDWVNNIRGTGVLQLDGSVVVEQRPRLCGEPEADAE
jgi:hypothetical protein